MPIRMPKPRHRCHLPPLLALLLAACGSVPPQTAPQHVEAVPARPPVPSSAPASASAIPVLPPAGSGRGGYYQDDGPGDSPPPDLLDVPDAEPRIEPYLPRANRPYVVFGKTYTPIVDSRPFKERGMGSWYGKKFQGQKTSSGELYDMYKMTAAHPTLPIPSYARVTNLSNGKQVVVRINDRGPFHPGRIIDLSYTAALKLGYLSKGSSELEVERLLPEDIERMAAAKKEQTTSPAEPVTAVAKTEAAPTADAPVEAPPAVLALAPAVSADTLAPGFYLQFGTYTQADNAEAARGRLQQKAESGMPPVQVAAYGLFYRLYSGPFATRDEAVAAAQHLQDDGDGKPLVVQR